MKNHNKLLKGKSPSLFNIVLVQPEIPSNTGNIGRLCVATNSKLHLVGPLSFDLSDKYLKRAGLDYWKHLNYEVYDNFKIWEQKHIQRKPSSSRFYFFSTKVKPCLYQQKFNKMDYFIFGSETKGLKKEIIDQYSSHCFRIPMSDSVRSLNLSNAVSVVVYEAIRQSLL